MKVLLKLFVIQLKHALSYNTSAGRRKRQSRSVWLALLLIAGIGLYIGGVYSFQLAMAFHQAGQLGMLFVTMSGLAVLASLFLIVMGVSGLIFQAKDTTFLLSLPIKPQSVMLAKLMAVYGEALLISFFILAPSLVAYNKYQALPWSAYLLFLIVIVCLAMLATVLALLLGYVFGLVQSKTKATPALMNIIMLAGLAGLFYLSIRAQNIMLGETFSPTSLPSSLLKIAAPLYWVRDILVDGNVLSLLKLGLISVIPLAFATWLLSHRFVSIISSLAIRRKASDYRGPSRRQSPLKALLRKELKQYFGTPAYFVNTFFGPLLAIGGSIYLFVIRDKLTGLEDVFQLINLPLGFILTASLVGLVSFNNTTAPSISLEGSRLWILKSLPVSTESILLAKILLNLIIVGPAILVAATIANLLFRLPLIERILIYLIPLLALLVSAMVGLIANIHYPKLDAPSDTAAVKNSTSVWVGSLGVMLGTIAFFIFLYGFRTVLGGALLYVALIAYLVLTIGLYHYLKTKGVAKFKQII